MVRNVLVGKRVGPFGYSGESIGRSEIVSFMLLKSAGSSGKTMALETIETEGGVSIARKLAGILNQEIFGVRFRQGEKRLIDETMEESVLVEKVMDYEPEA
ncbi:hypothetical protein AMTR_s00039p00102000 [Amborella trichopoda]|uniref:Uncharacterized protein n=1 Tax=Amborella trichopoda TaxID=13333 RepID=U5D2Y0_AMBTC|nr:hypothetical protein AMTR_s00039p00102000 [Amborella trichopoda]